MILHREDKIEFTYTEEECWGMNKVLFFKSFIKKQQIQILMNIYTFLPDKLLQIINWLPKFKLFNAFNSYQLMD